MVKNNRSEASIQQELVRWYKNGYCLAHHNPRCMIFSVPNESNGQRAARLIQTGLYSGCADLVVIHLISRYSILPIQPMTVFIEVKTTTGIQSDKQKTFEEHCKQIGVQYHVVRSLDDFKTIIGAL